MNENETLQEEIDKHRALLVRIYRNTKNSTLSRFLLFVRGDCDIIKLTSFFMFLTQLFSVVLKDKAVTQNVDLKQRIIEANETISQLGHMCLKFREKALL